MPAARMASHIDSGEEIAGRFIELTDYKRLLAFLPLGKLIRGEDAGEFFLVAGAALKKLLAFFAHRSGIFRSNTGCRSHSHCRAHVRGTVGILAPGAGHAVVADILEPGSVNLISIRVAEGNKGGVTSYQNHKDYYLRMIYRENRVRALLGGKASTENVFGETDVGSLSDLERAFDVIQRLRDDFSAFGFFSTTVYRSPDIIRSEAHRTMTQKMEDYYRETKKILADHRPYLDAVAKALLEKETLLGCDLARIRQTVEG